MLEPYEGKLSRAVLRGEGGSNTPDLPDDLCAHGKVPKWSATPFSDGSIPSAYLLLRIPSVLSPTGFLMKNS